MFFKMNNKFPSCFGEPVEPMDPSVEFCESCPDLEACVKAMQANGHESCDVMLREVARRNKE